MSDNIVPFQKAKFPSDDKPLVQRLHLIVESYHGAPCTEQTAIECRQRIVDELQKDYQQLGYVVCAACEMQTTLDKFIVNVNYNGKFFDIQIEHNQAECFPRQQMRAAAKAGLKIPVPMGPGEAKDAAELELLTQAILRMVDQLIRGVGKFQENYNYEEIVDQTSSMEAVRCAMSMSELDEINKRLNLVHTHIRYLQVVINSR